MAASIWVLVLSLLTVTTTAIPTTPEKYARQAIEPSATVEAGVVIGIQTSLASSPNLVNKYLGVPFAASPTRFAPATTVTPWNEPYRATQNGPACIQQFNYPEASRNFTTAAFNTPAPPESEDCLSVNIFAPASAQAGGDLKPVMFWIYGGSLQFGSNSQPAYDGSSFAANQDVVLVATNYRTNVFGFPSAPSLPLTQRNLGYLDQRFALAWVQRNIASFGGDPSRVTIFGESAGSFSVDSLVTSFGASAPDGPPPFHAAIMESGQSSVSSRQPATLASWTALIKALNCSSSNAEDDLACARAAPATTLKSIVEHAALTFNPTQDNYTQLQYPELARRTGQIARVPIMTGTNANEGTIFTFTQNDTVAFLSSSFNNTLTPSQIQGIVSSYPPGQRGIINNTTQIGAIVTDLSFECPCAIVANDSAASQIPTWRYFYNASFPGLNVIPGLDYDFGVYHSSEIPLVFGTYGARPGVDIGQSGERLSELMQSMWATFARNPYGGPAPGWKHVNDGGFIQVIGGRGGLNVDGTLRRDGSVSGIDGRRCELWSAVYG